MIDLGDDIEPAIDLSRAKQLVHPLAPQGSDQQLSRLSASLFCSGTASHRHRTTPSRTTTEWIRINLC
jgi:hypothetical protein